MTNLTTNFTVFNYRFQLSCLVKKNHSFKNNKNLYIYKKKEKRKTILHPEKRSKSKTFNIRYNSKPAGNITKIIISI